LSPGRHFLCRMNFSNAFVDFYTGFWAYPLFLFWLLCFFSFSPVWVCQWRHKAIANTSKYAQWKKFSYSTFLVDVTLAVCELPQKLCSNVNISASTVPKRFIARVKIPIISVEPPFHEMFFSIVKFLAHTSSKLKEVKTFVQCSLLEKLPWNANVVGMSHEHWPHANFTCFQKIILVIFGQGYQWWKLLFFLVSFGQGWQRWRVLVLSIFDQGYQWWKFCLILVIFVQGYQRWQFLIF